MIKLHDQMHLNAPEVKRRFDKNICLLVYSYDRHLHFTKACMESFKKFDLFTILAWDRGKQPPQEIIDGVDCFHIKPKCQSSVVYSWVWHSLATSWVADHFDYIFSVSGDCYFERPQGLPEVIEKMGDSDVCAYWYDNNRIGTMAWICRSHAYRNILHHICKNWEDPDRNGNMVEARVMRAVKAFGYKIAKTMEGMFSFVLPPDGDTEEKRGRGYFGEVLGMRHLHWEQRRRAELGLPQLGKELMDL